MSYSNYLGSKRCCDKLSGPQGSQGSQGSGGPIGPIGLTGRTGPQGARGQTGCKGSTGATGSTGSQGLSGEAGGNGGLPLYLNYTLEPVIDPLIKELDTVQLDASGTQQEISISGFQQKFISQFSDITNITAGVYTLYLYAYSELYTATDYWAVSYSISTCDSQGSTSTGSAIVTNSGLRTIDHTLSTLYPTIIPYVGQSATLSGLNTQILLTLTFTKYGTNSNILYINYQNASGSGGYSLMQTTFSPIGATGATGATGSQGATGATGATGPPGPPGAGGAIGYYGSFYDTTTQGPLILDTATAIKINTTDPSVTNGVYIGATTSRIYNTYTGIYNVQFSAQFGTSSTGNDVDLVNIWIKKNGDNVPDTDGQVSIPTKAGGTISSWNYLLALNASDYIEFYVKCISSNLKVSLTTFGATGTGLNDTPRSPSIIVTYTQAAYNGPTGPQGATGSAGATGPGISVLGAFGQTGATASMLMSYPSTAGTTGIYYSDAMTYYNPGSTDNPTFWVTGNLFPTKTNTYSLGTTGATWKEIIVGPGTITFATPAGQPIASIGANQAGNVYTENGFATPSINIGPAIDPSAPIGALGGWHIYTGSTAGGTGTSLVTQQIDAGGTGYTGPIYSLINSGQTGATGAAGATGATGAAGATGATGATGSSSIGIYGSYYSTINMYNTGATSGGPIRYMLFENVETSNGMTSYNSAGVIPGTTASLGYTGATGTIVQFGSTGTYNLQVSAQINKTDPGNDILDFWVVRGGTAIPYSNNSFTVTANNTLFFANSTKTYTFNKDELLQMAWHSDDPALFLKSTVASGIVPGAPSANLNIIKISN